MNGLYGGCMLTTTIKWRKWPEEKPPRGQYLVLSRGIITMRLLSNRFNSPMLEWYFHQDSAVDNGVTHFALPEDITTQDAAPSLGGKRGEQA